jgi:hypothetical protein
MEKITVWYGAKNAGDGSYGLWWFLNRAKAEQNNCTDSEIEAYNQQITILASILSDLNKILHDKTISVESKNSWSAVEFSTDNWFDDLTDNYPNGVIIQKK